ncbi:MAG: DUF1320 family protein [Verrucomicrobia bacterium]|nr:DUF1320 family protein [Verrucomicrobiota bacterium]
MFLTPEEVNTHLYGEVVTEISRADTTILQSAISAAIEEAKGYLTAYDLTAIFSATGADRNSVLLLFCKDIAVWHFINLSNPAVEMQLRLERYEKAIKWLEKVQSGKTNPSLPFPEVTPPAQANNYLKWGGNYKRSTNF